MSGVIQKLGNRNAIRIGDSPSGLTQLVFQGGVQRQFALVDKAQDRNSRKRLIDACHVKSVVHPHRRTVLQVGKAGSGRILLSVG
jgi:hypothetical protein